MIKHQQDVHIHFKTSHAVTNSIHTVYNIDGKKASWLGSGAYKDRMWTFSSICETCFPNYLPFYK